MDYYEDEYEDQEMLSFPLHEDDLDDEPTFEDGSMLYWITKDFRCILLKKIFSDTMKFIEAIPEKKV